MNKAERLDRWLFIRVDVQARVLQDAHLPPSTLRARISTDDAMRLRIANDFIARYGP